MDDRFDFVIIGAGAAGEASANMARSRGASVAVIERELVGGSCPFWACMPSKALLHAAAVHAAGGPYDWPRAAARRDWIIGRKGTGKPSDAGHVRDLERAGAIVLRGSGRFAGPGRVLVMGPGGSRGRTLRAQHVILAIGSEPAIPKIDGLDDLRVWTNRDATSTRELPSSLAILGGGATGVELAQVFARFGVRTTLVASQPRVFHRGHARNSAALEATLRADGVDIRLSARAIRVRPGAGRNGAHVVDLSDGSTAQGHEVLAAVGRTIPLDGLGLETIGVDASTGRFQVGPDLQIAERVFVAGDPAGAGMFTHVAWYQGEMAVRIALGDEVRPDFRAIPHAVYTEPEVAGVGLLLEQARAGGHDAFEETVDLAMTAKGETAEATGHVTIVVDRATRTLLGAFVAAPAASEVIHEAVLAIRAGVTLDVLADTIHAFPTAARVLGTCFGLAVRTLDAGPAGRR